MAPAPEPLAISSSKKKLAGFGVGSAACAAFGIKWWMVADAALVGTGVAVVGIGFFALCGLYCFVKMCDRSPGLGRHLAARIKPQIICRLMFAFGKLQKL